MVFQKSQGPHIHIRAGEFIFLNLAEKGKLQNEWLFKKKSKMSVKTTPKENEEDKNIHLGIPFS